MPKNRTIPFGYCMKNGEITTEPKEVYAVVTIFDEYLEGRSLSEIAKLMQSEKIRYNAVSDKWNKNMVKRIIFNDPLDHIFVPLIRNSIVANFL